MEIKGRIVQVLPMESGTSAKGPWHKQNYILQTTDTQYARKVCFNLWGDKVEQYAIKEGEELVVSIDIESREFNGRWYTDVRAWKVDRVADLPQQAPNAGYPYPQGGGYNQGYPQQPQYGGQQQFAQQPQYGGQQQYAQPQAPQFAPQPAQSPDGGLGGGSNDDLPF